MTIAPVLFGTDGVRGLAGKYPLDKSLLRKLGAAAAAVLKQRVRGVSPVFLLGRDTRRSGSWIAESFAQGAQTQGVYLLDVGVVPTPSVAYLVPRRRVLGGVMISASHNPAVFNGVKLFGPNGRKCPDAWERAMENFIAQSPDVPPVMAILQKDRYASAEYLEFLRRTVPQETSLQGMKLVVDCAHGSLARIAPAFLRRMGARVIAIGATPNGRNINAGWGSQHPQKMQRLVVERKASGGVAFDGDGDRAIFCDEQGRLLDGDFILACCAHALKEEKRLSRNRVVVTVMANLGLVKTLRAWGIETTSTPVGDRYVSEELEETGAVLGGEQSGHVIFREFLPTGDGLLTALQVLTILQRRRHPFSWVHSLFERYPQILENVVIKHRKPLEECHALQEEIRRARTELGDQGRVVVRYSGTEPLLRIMMEGPDKARLESLAQLIRQQARQALGPA